jgi:hypothetical protein
MRKRKVTYPTAKTATRKPRTAGLPGDPGYVRSTVAEIDLTALAGRDDIAVGHRVRIGGDGLYSGETAVVESLVGGLIPAAMVRTEAGKTRRVRAVDLQRLPAASAQPPQPPAGALPVAEPATAAPASGSPEPAATAQPAATARPAATAQPATAEPATRPAAE